MRWRSGAAATLLRLRGKLCGGEPLNHRSECYMDAGEKDPGHWKGEECNVGGVSARDSVRWNLKEA